MGNWLAIDHGAKRIGVAGGNTTSGIASPLVVIAAEPADKVFRRIAQLARQYEADGIVVGWPLNMDDSEGPQGKIARAMALELSREIKLDVRLWDERLSSFTADGILAGKLTRLKKRRRQDAVAAAVILQDFFSNGGPDSAPRPDDFTDQ